MLRKLLQALLRKPLTYLGNRFSGAPEKKSVHQSLDLLYREIQKGKAGATIPFSLESGRYIIFSDQHKGIRDAADDFREAETTYLHALSYYFSEGFTLINNGDAEELWENKPADIIKSNQECLKAEARFLLENRYYRIYGNHDLEWKYDLPCHLHLHPLFGTTLKIHEGVLLQTSYKKETWSILITHGHQGDYRSDGNNISQWMVAALWTPLQRFLDININTTADSFERIDKHNTLMNEWSNTQQNLLFVSGHTHVPVFALLNHSVNQHQKQEDNPVPSAEAIAPQKKESSKDSLDSQRAKPTYFNTGCCCYSDGSITGIEIENEFIRLIQWSRQNGNAVRTILEENTLKDIFERTGA